MLLDCFAERIGCRLSSFKAALRNLDSLPPWRAASKERVAPSRFSVPPEALCDGTSHLGSPPELIGTKVASLGC
jgi:hypothetical protein